MRTQEAMSDRTRLMIFRVMDGVQTPEMLHIMHGLYNFKRCDEMLLWLINNCFRGYPLVNWFRHDWQRSIFEMGKYILSSIDRTKKDRIIHRVDWG